MNEGGVLLCLGTNFPFWVRLLPAKEQRLIHFIYMRNKPDSRPKHKKDGDLTLDIGRKDCNQSSINKWQGKMAVEELQRAVGNNLAYSRSAAELPKLETVVFSWVGLDPAFPPLCRLLSL